MTTKINPPDLMGKSYECYKQELLAWSEVTNLNNNKKGVAVALLLPELKDQIADKIRQERPEVFKIRGQVFDQIPIDDLKKENGLEILIAFMDIHLGKDDLVDSLEKYEQFDNFIRGEKESIECYIAEFDILYRRVEKKKMSLPSEVLAFQLLKRAKLAEDEKLLVLTGMDYSKRESLYEQTKTSLKKFKGGEWRSNLPSSTIPAVKLEPAFLADNEEALYSAGYVRRDSFSGRGGYRGNNFRGYRGYNSVRGNFQRGGIFRGNYSGVPKLTKKLNSIGPDGNPLTCRSCGSYRHMLAECPDSYENISRVNLVEDEENVILFTGNQKADISFLGKDAQNCAVLDSACSSTVCGSKWMDNFIEYLDDENKQKIKVTKGHKIFKFGGGTCLKSMKHCEIPVTMAGQKVTLNTDVVNSDIPLLLSREAMKKAEIKLNTIDDTAEILGKSVSLNLTTSGHYCIPICPTFDEIPIETVCLASLPSENHEDQLKVLLKLHRQFAHPTQKKFIVLLKDAGAWREEYEEILLKIYERCDTCKEFATTPPRPVVGLPMTKVFNEIVAIDLKYRRGKLILHVIDMWSRYTLSVFVNSKKPRDIINHLMKNWVAVFGIMGGIMSDNGGEFSNEELREVASILNIRLITTAAESPFQNGLCERVHSITDAMLDKLEADYPKTDLHLLLCWANMARNSLSMWNGYSSHQLVFGISPNLPNIMNETLPAFHGTTTSEVFAEHLNALQSARRAYIQTEASERIRRALRSKIRVSEESYLNGDRVFYKRDGKNRWLGPGKVVFQDGKVIFIRHGGVFIRASPNRVKKAENPFEKFAEDDDLIANQTLIKSKENIEETIGEEQIEQEHFNLQNENSQRQLGHDQTIIPNLKPGDKIIYRIEDNNQWTAAEVLGRAGKATGVNKYWYNIKDTQLGEPGKRSIDLEQVEWRRQEDTQTEEEVNSVELEEAKTAELNKFKKFNTYQEVDDYGQTTVSTRWVISNKNGQVKARLVARGFEEETDFKTDSPTVGKGAIRLFLCICASKNWTIKTTDIKSAFLQGKCLEREVYLAPPKESKTLEGKIWKLNHCLYGLKDGARQFYLSVKEELIKLGCKQSNLDPALFSYYINNETVGIVCCHVDDFLHGGTEVFNKIMEKLTERFRAGKEEQTEFCYIGFRFLQNQNGIVLDHSDFIEKLECTPLHTQRARNKDDILTSDEQTIYRKTIGQLNWVVQVSRPDMAFEQIDLSTKLQQATVGDLNRANKAINRLKDIKTQISFRSFALNPEKWEIHVYSDASLNNINDGTGSVGAHIILLYDRSLDIYSPVVWQAKKIKRVVRSTIAAEALSLEEGLESAVYYRKMLEDILNLKPQSVKVMGFTDNKSVIESLESTSMCEDKRLRIDIAAMKEMLEQNIYTKWCEGCRQLANCMTKKGANGLTLLNVLCFGETDN